MNDSTITALAALATGLGVGPLLPKIWDTIATAFTRGGVSRKRDQSERLRAELGKVTAERDGLRARLVRLLDRNRILREIAEAYRFQLIRAGITPNGEYPPLNEETDGP